jgi:transcriptional regulator with XRE-family HTH domain
MREIKLDLKTARKLSGLTAREASKKADLNVETLLGYEHKRNYPRVDKARDLAKIYGFEFRDIDFF